MRYANRKDLNFLQRNLDRLAILRGSAEIGIVPLRFELPEGMSPIACGYSLIDIHDYTKAGFLFCDCNSARPNCTTASILNLLVSFGYEAYSWTGLEPDAASSGGWERFEPLARSIKDYLNGIDLKFFDADYITSRVFPNLPISIAKEAVFCSKAPPNS